MEDVNGWNSYPKHKPTKPGWYICHNGIDAYWMNKWLGKRWQHHASEMEWWTELPPLPPGAVK